MPTTLLLSVPTALLLCCGAWRVRGTTLSAAAVWSVAAVIAVAAAEVAVAILQAAPAASGDSLRYAAAVTVLCPMMAVLGAKRPQNLAWQWVVVSLLAVLWLPVARQLVRESGTSVEVSVAWHALILVLIGVGLCNYLPTRNWPAALVAIAGQSALLGPYVGLNWSPGGVPQTITAMTCFLVATGIAGISAKLRRRHANGGLGALDSQWLKFRDAFGAFWGLRAMQRINQGAESAALPIRLTWRGWALVPGTQMTGADDMRPSIAQAARLTRTVLRRFARM